jgi:membrane associated rhomboid family serine protease
VNDEDPLGGLARPSAPEPRLEPERLERQRRRLPATPTTVLLLAVIGAGFAAQLALGKTENEVLASFRLGSLMPAAVLQGDWYRLGSYAFLHGGWVHLLVNAWALWVLMRPIEAALGPFPALGIFSGTAIAGGATSVAWNLLRANPLQTAVGASGGIFGLFGAHCAIFLRVRKYLPPAARAQTSRVLLYDLVINLALAIGAVAQGFPLDNAAHVGGFLSGMAFGAIASVPRLLPPRPWHRAAAMLFTLCAFTLASMEGAAVARAARPPERTLHGDGVEAVVPWKVVEWKPGIAIAPGAFEIHLEKSNDPIDENGKVVRLAGKDWRERRAVDSEGTRYIDVEVPQSRILVRIICPPEPCEEDKRDALAEEIASHARTTGPP